VSARCSLVIPVYRNEGSIPDLLEALEGLRARTGELEVVFVIDGSPDRSLQLLQERLPRASFASQLIALSRNFGAFCAVHAGLAAGTGEHFAVMAADLQEPPELVAEFFEALRRGEADVTIGQRVGRDDPLLARAGAALFWGLYRRIVQPELPPGGVDVFGCTKAVRDVLVGFTEANTSLVGLLFWAGFRRKLLPYARRPRKHGTSAWSLRRKLKYLTDSAFAFTDLPIRLLQGVGAAGVVFALGLGAVVFAARVAGVIDVPGYTTLLLVVLLAGAANLLGLGIVGGYVWRAFENTKGRPLYVEMSRARFVGAAKEAAT
jgi:glycosyltransferase involved in cell wall biosynthesis